MAKLETKSAGETLAHKKLDIQKLLAPAALVILYVFFSFAGNNFFTPDTLKNILESSYYIGFMAFGVTFIIITGGIDLLRQAGVEVEHLPLSENDE